MQDKDEDVLKRARRKAVRAHFAACKAARADSVRQAHRDAVRARSDAEDDNSNAKEAAGAAADEAEFGCKLLAQFYQTVVIHTHQELLEEKQVSELSEEAYRIHQAAKRASGHSELAQRAADRAAKGAEFAKACSDLARARGKRASDTARDSATEAYWAAYEYARLRVTDGVRKDRKSARAHMRHAAKCLQAIGHQRSESLEKASESHLRLVFYFTRWPFRICYGVFRFLHLLWDWLFDLIEFLVKVVRRRRFAKQDENARSQAVEACRARAELATGESDPSFFLGSATLAEFAFKCGAIGCLIEENGHAAREEADAAEYEREQAEKQASAAILSAADAKGSVEFAEYCAVRADLLVARHWVDSSGKIAAPSASRYYDGYAKAEDSGYAGLWAKFGRAKKRAGEKLERARKLAGRAYRVADGTASASLPFYVNDGYKEWIEGLGTRFASSTLRVPFVDARRAAQHADLAGCSYYAAFITSFLAEAGALAEKAALAQSRKDFQKAMKDALERCENALSLSEHFIKKEVAEAERGLFVPEKYASAKAFGLIAGFPQLAKYGKQARAGIRTVKEALECAKELDSSDSSFSEVRPKVQDATHIACTAALREYDSWVKVLSKLITFHKNGILESNASLKARKTALSDHLNKSTIVVEREETAIANVYEAAGNEYETGQFSQQLEQLTERAAKVWQDPPKVIRWSHTPRFGSPFFGDQFQHWDDKSPYEELEAVLECYNNIEQRSTMRDKQISNGDEESAPRTVASIENRIPELQEVTELFRYWVENTRLAEFLASTNFMGASAKAVLRKAREEAKEAEALGE